jgi:aminopeptidase N
MDTAFVSKVLHQALLTDSKASSHPVEATIDSEARISQVFDSLSYNKAGSGRSCDLLVTL